MRTPQWLPGGLLATMVIMTLISPGHSAPATPVPEVPPVLFTYNPQGLRDPFIPNADLWKKAPAACTTGCEDNVQTRPPEPLEMFPLESLKFVGTLMFAGGITAIIEDPAGQAYSVKKGHYMGSNEGQITEIGSGHLLIRERAPTPSDKKATRIVTLKLHKDEEEK